MSSRVTASRTNVRVTTSWDDGNEKDLRIASLLVERGLRGTFYVPRAAECTKIMSTSQIRELADMPGVEIGSHTLTHPDLRRVPAARFREEVLGGRAWLEDVIGRPVPAFCYPKGLHTRRMGQILKEWDFDVARTTINGVSRGAVDSHRMPTTMQFYDHHRLSQVRHALKEGNLGHLAGVWQVHTADATICARVKRIVQEQEVDYFHLWGHSWEIDRHELWDQLAAGLSELVQLGVPLTNGEIATAAG
jgi:peptidoglycan/xylan/chitin deacetylase (PgdA/CDA1 family)